MIIEFSGVEKRYGKTKALAGANLEVPPGVVMGMIGPNGAGKTTSMMIMTGLLPRDAGLVRVAGIDPAKDARGVRRIVGFMPDFFGVYESLRVDEYLEFFAASHGVRRAARRAVVADLLALVELGDKADADVNTLSRGMKQRLSLARALVHDPQILILDEPASGLDPRARAHLRELIVELGRMGRTVLISSHILPELEGMCSHLAVVDRGTVLAQGEVEDIRDRFLRHARISVRVQENDLPEAEEIIRANDGIQELWTERNLLRYVSDGRDVASERTLAALIGAGIRVAEFRVERASIEDLFLQVTGERIPVELEPGEVSSLADQEITT